MGPAGTGKTETVKDLSRLLGRPSVVINCSDQIDYKMLSQILMGGIGSGTWLILDEFNRIVVEVLTTFSQQIKQVMGALRAEQNSLCFEGCELTLHSSFGLFITMNPGYCGRTELPSFLKE